MPNLVWDLAWKDRGVVRGLNQVTDAQDKAERKAKAYRQVAGVAFLALGVAAVKWGKDSVRAYGEAQTAQAKLSDAFSRFPRLADTNQTALQRLNLERQKSTRFDDDATAAAQAQLAQYKLTGGQLRELTPLLQDYAAKTGKDMTAAAKDAGNAVLGKGRALRSIGLDLKDTGTATGNYEQLVKGLRTQVGGFAEKEGKTAAGSFEILKNAVGELQEQTGEHLVPAVSATVEGLTDLVEVVGENSDVIVPLAGVVAGLTTAIWLGHKAAKAYAVMQGIMGAAMSSNSRVATGLASVVSKAGPWGLAIAGGATLVGVFAGQQALAKRETKAFTDSLTFQKGALDANSAQMLVKKLADEGALETAKRAGIAEGDYVRALLQGGPARDGLINQLYATEAAAQANADALTGDTTAHLDQAEAAQKAAGTLKLYGGGLDASKRAAELAESAFKGSSAATEDQGTKAKTAKLSLEELAASMFKASNAALALSGSEIGFEQAVDDATRAVKTNGKTLDTNTQKGRDNKTALNNLATSSAAYISKLVETGKKTKEVNQKTADARAAFIKTAISMGQTKEQAIKLADKYGLIPGKKETKVTTPGMHGKQGALQSFDRLDTKMDAITGKDVTVGINWRTSVDGYKTSFVGEYFGGKYNSGPSRGVPFAANIGGPPLSAPEDVHGGPTVTANIRGGVPKFTPSHNRMTQYGARRLTSFAGDRLRDDVTVADSTAPGGRVGVSSRSMAATMLAMQHAGARRFTTYPGHHPSMNKARDVTPHNWAIANAARASSSVWYVIYRMMIASKNHGNVWRPYHPTNFRGDWQHTRHVHVGWYDKGGMLPPGISLAVNKTGRAEVVRPGGMPAVIELGPRSIAAIASALTVEIDGKQVARAVRYQTVRGTT